MRFLMLLMSLNSLVWAETHTRIQDVVVLDCSPKAGETAETPGLKRCRQFADLLRNCGVEVVASAAKREAEVAGEFWMGNGLTPGSLVSICTPAERIKKKGASDQVETVLGELFCSEMAFNAADKLSQNGILDPKELKLFLSAQLGARSRARAGLKGFDELDPCLPLPVLSQESPQLKLPSGGLKSPWRSWDSGALVPHAQGPLPAQTYDRNPGVLEEPERVVIEPDHD